MEVVDFWKMFKPIRDKMNISDDAVSDFSVEISPTNLDYWKNGEFEGSIDESGAFIFTDNGCYYEGQRVVVYIRDQHHFHHETEYKFHITWCQTLSTMHKNNRYGKYVFKRTPDKNFKVNIDGEEKYKKLPVCKHCLQKLDWHNYRKVTPAQHDIICECFSLAEFFESVNDDNKSLFASIPNFDEDTAPLNVYPANWKIIAYTLKLESDFRCSACHKQFPNAHGLHVHHKNGMRNDYRRTNLEVLCADCHQKRHSHKIIGSSR